MSTRLARLIFVAMLLRTIAGCGDRERPASPPGGGSVGSGTAATSSSTTTAATGSSGSGGAGGAVGPMPDELDLPPIYGTCPNLTSGRVTFEISGLDARDVELRLSSKTETLDGPLVVVWHGGSQTPKAALDELLGSKLITKVMAAGGVVAVPYHDPKASSSIWHSSEGDAAVDDDFVLLDQIVACTRENLGIDTRHIHLVGFQQNGFQAAHSAVRRSGYVASAVVHSGGLSGDWVEQKPGLAYPFMIVHGGEALDVGEQNYGLSSAGLAKLAAEGSPPFTVEHFTVLCDHGNGSGVAPDVLPSTYEFMMDTPFGTTTSPYGSGLDDIYPTYCSGNSP